MSPRRLSCYAWSHHRPSTCWILHVTLCWDTFVEILAKTHYFLTARLYWVTESTHFRQIKFQCPLFSLWQCVSKITIDNISPDYSKQAYTNIVVHKQTWLKCSTKTHAKNHVDKWKKHHYSYCETKETLLALELLSYL